MAERVPIFNAPAVVTALIGALVAVHLVLAVVPEGQAAEWTALLGFSPGRFGASAAEWPGGRLAAYTSLVTHTLVHGDLAHLLINSAWMLAFGSAVARRIGTVRFLALYVVGAIAGALAFWAMHPGANTLVIGASGAVSALMGAAFRFVFRAFNWVGARNMADAATSVPRMTLAEVFRDRSLALSIAVYVAINFLMALWADGLTSMGGIAWEAHLGGFFLGLLAFGLFDRSVPPPAPPSPSMRHEDDDKGFGEQAGREPKQPRTLH